MKVSKVFMGLPCTPMFSLVALGHGGNSSWFQTYRFARGSEPLFVCPLLLSSSRKGILHLGEYSVMGSLVSKGSADRQLPLDLGSCLKLMGPPLENFCCVGLKSTMTT